MADGYIKGKFDRGDLAGKFVALIVVDDLDMAKNIAKALSEDEHVTVHEVAASSYDIDYNIHKLSLSPAYGVD